tara:strand:+ start:18529 stop:19062 length:534 start_codon:yes stop_codon:yes gene_type:complete
MIYYGTLTDAAVYHDARGNSAWSGYTAEQQEAALTRGSDYLDQRYRERLKSGKWVSMFSGSRTDGRSQENEWPRTGATDYEGNEIGSSEVPVEVKNAAYEAALREAATPGSLSPDFTMTEQVTKEKVGPIEVQYADTTKAMMPKGVETPNRPIISEIDEIIAPVLVARYDYPGVRVV